VNQEAAPALVLLNDNEVSMRISILLIALCGTLFMEACSSCGPAPTTPTLAWGVLDKTNNVSSQFPSGGTFSASSPNPLNPGDQYLITLQVQEPEGIKEMDISGAGNLTCSTNQSPSGFVSVAPNPLPVSIPTQTTTIPNPGSTSGFVTSQPFVYYKLDCGQHQYANMPQAAEFFATSGTIQIQGTDITWAGTKRTATLNITY
jgi:hypothetical protein